MSDYGFLLTVLGYGFPIVMLFYMGIEITLRDRSILNRISSGLFLCMSCLFVASFFISVFPEQNIPVIYFSFMLLPAYLLIGLAVHFTLRLTSRYDHWPASRMFCVCYLQSALFLVMLIPNPYIYVDASVSGIWKSAQPSPLIFVLIIIPGIYTVSACTYLLVQSRRYIMEQGMMHKKKQLRVILLAISISGVFNLVTAWFNRYLIIANDIRYPEPGMTLGLMFFAVMIRYAIIKYAFLPTIANKYKVLYKHSPVAILLINEKQQIIEANPAAEKLFVGEPSLLKVPVNVLLQPCSSDIKTDQSSKRFKAETQHNHRIVEIETEEVISGGEKHQFMLLWDITRSIEAEKRILYIANHDSLTELANRGYYREALAASIESLRNGLGHMVAVMLLDLDRFKKINDTKGHHVGDMLLQYAADVLRQCGHEAKLIARIGGDEFSLLFQGKYDESDIAAICERILTGLQVPFVYEQDEFQITTSIGVCMLHAPVETPESLLQYADIAMYESKRNGRNQYTFFTEQLKAAQDKRISMETKLREAIADEDFIVHYQPQIDLRSGEAYGAEALVRWRDKSGNMIPPADFIPVLEENGLIVSLGLLVLRKTCEYGSAWLRDGMPELSFSVNVSNRELMNPQWLSKVESILEETRFPARLLRIEITESAAASTEPHMHGLIRALREKGIKLSIDDFGTGYSTFSALQSGHFQQLKIDRSIVKDICVEETAYNIVAAMIGMAHSLNLHVVAEGVEDHAQLELLRAMNCDAIQGYYASRPIPGGQLRMWVTHVRRQHKRIG